MLPDWLLSQGLSPAGRNVLAGLNYQTSVNVR